MGTRAVQCRNMADGRELIMATVLLVEDDPDLQSAYALSLTQSGFEVVTACDGKELIEIVSTNKIDILVSDTNLLTLDGDIACKRLLDQGYLSDVLILGMSDDRDCEAHWQDMGIEFLYKGGMTDLCPLGPSVTMRWERFKPA